jgi:hypothetical protein
MSIAANAGAYAVLAVLMGVMWARSPAEVILWGAFFALLGLVTTLFCVVAWVAALHQLANPGTLLNRHGSQFRALCVVLILGGALIGLSKAITIPLVGL